MVVVGEEGFVMVTTAGLPLSWDQVPVPMAAMVAVEYWQVVWSGPAFGFAVTVTYIVSVQMLLDHTYPYMPATVKPVIVVVSLVRLAITVVAGLVERMLHVPVPIDAVVTVLYWQIVWSSPAELIGVTSTFIESVHPLFVHT